MSMILKKCVSFFLSFLLVFILFPAIPKRASAAGTPGTYHVYDISVINNLIENNGLDLPKAPADGSAVPAEWEWHSNRWGYVGIEWTDTESNRQITRIALPDSGLYGTVQLRGLTELEYLSCEDNAISRLDVSACSELYWLYCDNNKITEIDFSDCDSLSELVCSDNLLTALDFSGHPQMIYVSCSNNQLAVLDFSVCEELMALYCSDNLLSALDITTCKWIDALDCSNNRLAKLDLGERPYLWMLNCSGNNLTSLDLRGCSDIQELWCANNQLTALYLPNTQLWMADLRFNCFADTGAVVGGAIWEWDWEGDFWHMFNPQKVISLNYDVLAALYIQAWTLCYEAPIGAEDWLRQGAPYFPSEADREALSAVLDAIAAELSKSDITQADIDAAVQTLQEAMDRHIAYYQISTLPGDANMDGTVTAADAATILRHLAGLTELSQQGLQNAETDGQTGLTAGDAAQILRALAALSVLLPT